MIQVEYTAFYDCGKDEIQEHKNCIYFYINKINGKGYIGQTVDFKNRHRTHVQKSSNKYPIDKAINKHGIDNFEVYIIVEDRTIEELNSIEQELIKKYNTSINQNGYNIREGGNNSRMSESTKAKLSNSKKGKAMSEEQKQLFSEMFSGERNPFYGKQHTEETKKRLSEARKGQPSPRKGVKLSTETKEKLSLARKGKYRDGDNPSAKAVICVNTGEVFPTIKQASEWCGIGRASIIQSCRKNYAGGKHPETGEKLYWQYVSDNE